MGSVDGDFLFLTSHEIPNCASQRPSKSLIFTVFHDSISDCLGIAVHAGGTTLRTTTTAVPLDADKADGIVNSVSHDLRPCAVNVCLLYDQYVSLSTTG